MIAGSDTGTAAVNRAHPALAGDGEEHAQAPRGDTGRRVNGR